MEFILDFDESLWTEEEMEEFFRGSGFVVSLNTVVIEARLMHVFCEHFNVVLLKPEYRQAVEEWAETHLRGFWSMPKRKDDASDSFIVVDDEDDRVLMRLRWGHAYVDVS